MDLAEALPISEAARTLTTKSAARSEWADSPTFPYSVMFLSADGAVPTEIAVRLLNRCGGAMFRAFSCDLNAHRSVGPNCFARDSRRVDFMIYLHDAIKPADSINLPRDNRSLHWNISGLSRSTDPKEQERSLRKTELELETRIKLFVLVHEKEKKNSASISKRIEPRNPGPRHLMA